jgi:hypothetical protein
MKRAIVTTTISSPSKAVLKYIEIAERDGWDVIVVGDMKTPHEEYERLASQHECFFYLPPKVQEDIDKELSDAIGWRCIQRRNMGFVYAYRSGYEVIATIDDDNIPLDN